MKCQRFSITHIDSHRVAQYDALQDSRKSKRVSRKSRSTRCQGHSRRVVAGVFTFVDIYMSQNLSHISLLPVLETRPRESSKVPPPMSAQRYAQMHLHLNPPRPPMFKISRRTLGICFSILLLGQCAPVLDRVLAPMFESGLLAATLSPPVSYQFEIQSRGVIRGQCPKGNSILKVIPGALIQGAEGPFQELKLQASLCTEFGFRKRRKALSFCLPSF